MKKKVELLAPAGTMDALYAAIQNGCDAVYLGGSMFGARAFAGNFDKEEMIKAISYAHIYGVKVYVTMNTLLYEDEIDDAVAYAYFLYTHDVDAVIVQDLGLLDRLRIQIPDLELHASTQMHIHNKDGIELMKQCGVKRVVLPRETPIEEIRRLARLGIDLEVFVHGALCVCYSGQCLMSSVLFQRSGNRGACAQPCRMKYQLVKQQDGKEEVIPTAGDYLLSPKDLNTIEHMKELIDAGVTSFKIEGRMKRPEYVAQVVSLYREAMDAYLHAEEFIYDHKKEQELKKVFNRGFSAGHIFHQGADDYMNPYRPNHMGITLGKVLSIRDGKAEILLEETLTQGDGIRILDEREDQGWTVNKIFQNGLLVHEAFHGDIISLELRGSIKKGSVVLKTSDHKQLHELHKTIEKKQRKVLIDMKLMMRPHQAASLHVVDEDGFYVTLLSECMVEEAQNAPLLEERIQEQMRKCRDTPFEVRSLTLQLKGACFLSIGSLNQLRRAALEMLKQKRIQRHRKGKLLAYHKQLPEIRNETAAYAVVETMKQYTACEQRKEICILTKRRSLYEKLKAVGKPIWYHEGRVVKKIYHDTMMSGDIGAVNRGCQILDSSLNITNSYAAACLFGWNVKAVVLSHELEEEKAALLCSSFLKRYGQVGNFIIKQYGREELMISEYCPIQCHASPLGKKSCGICKAGGQFYLKDQKGHKFPILTDEACRMRLLDHQITFDKMQENSMAQKLIAFTLEDEKKTAQVLSTLLHA